MCLEKNKKNKKMTLQRAKPPKRAGPKSQQKIKVKMPQMKPKTLVEVLKLLWDGRRTSGLVKCDIWRFLHFPRVYETTKFC